MKITKTFISLLSLSLAVACSNNLEPIVSVTEDADFSISIETALSTLEQFMIEDGRIDTKSSANDYIDGYFTVSVAPTKASDSQSGNVLYAVNFKDDGGYAILSADSRIPDDILAVTDNGNVFEADFKEPVYDLTPTDNDDLSVEEFNEMLESGVLASAAKSILPIQCFEYAKKNIEDSGNEIIDNGSDNNSSGSVETDQGTYTWVVTKQVPRMVDTIWDQSTENNDLFNKYCPMVGLFTKHKAPAGCVSIALSQIIAYHEFPRPQVCNDVQIDYPEMKKIYSYKYGRWEGTEASSEMLSQFIFYVGTKARTKYHSIFGQTWGFAWPANAANCLEELGYKNVTLKNCYDEDEVLAMLDNGCPVFMSAKRLPWSGHAWVIDGYMIREYSNEAGKVTKKQPLIHCNWGWGGKSNGYVASGMFDSNRLYVSDGFESAQQHMYWYGVRVITYDNPNK